MRNTSRYYDPFVGLNLPNGVVTQNKDANKVQASSQKKAGKRAYLIRQDNNERIVINKVNYKIGKNLDLCDYVIKNNNAISRVHAEILLKSNQVYIVDKKSTNKTYVNGCVLQPEIPTPIKNGDEIRLANLLFKLSVE